MKRPHFGAGVLLALTAAGALALTSVSSASGTPPASSSPPSSATSTTSATWTLEQLDQEVCTRPDSGPFNLYFGTTVTGSTTEPIKLELQDLPTNVTSTGATVHPGELNDRGEFNTWVPAAVGPTPAGEYDIELVASDGTDSQSAPARLSIRADC